MTCPEAESIGAYVLGALNADEQFEIEQHIRDCASCKEAVLHFAHLPGVLNKLTLEDVLALPFDDDPEPEGGWLPASMHADALILSPMQADGPIVSRMPEAADVVPIDSPTRHRWLMPKRVLLAAAAVALVVAGGLIGRQLIGDSTSQTSQAQPAVTWLATDGVGGIDARVQLSSRDWGTDIQLHLHDVQPDQRCMLVVHTRGGASETTGWWTTTAAIREADVPASSSFALSDIARIDVVTSDNRVLASVTNSTR